MRTRPLGRTGLRVSELSLGTWGLSGDAYGAVDANVARATIMRALEMGFSLFDTADAYGAGQMESLLGEVLGGHPFATIVTRGGTDRSSSPARKRFDADYVRTAVERSLKRLKRDRIDLYLLHNPTLTTLAQDETREAMQELVKQGLVSHWGVSVSDSESARMAIQKGASVISIAYNLFHSAELHRLAGEIMVSGAGVLAHSTLSYGLLAGLWTAEKEFLEGDHRADRWTKAELGRRIEQLDGVRYLVRGDVQSMRAAAIRFVLANNLVSSAVLGALNVTELEQLVREAGSGPIYLADDAMLQLPRALERVGIET